MIHVPVEGRRFLGNIATTSCETGVLEVTVLHTAMILGLLAGTGMPVA